MITVLEKPEGGINKGLLISESNLIPTLSSLPEEIRKKILYSMYFKVAIALYSQWGNLVDDPDRLWNPGFSIDSFTLSKLLNLFPDEAIEAGLSAADRWLKSCADPTDISCVSHASKLAGKAFVEHVSIDRLDLSAIEAFLGVKTYEGVIEEASVKLSENQRMILVSIFRKAVLVGTGQPVKFLAGVEFPNISAPSASRSLRELENRRLIKRLPKKQVHLTALGWQVAKNLNLQHLKS